MDMVGDRRFLEIPGTRRHELPPLLVSTASSLKSLDRVVGMANQIIETEEMLSDAVLDELPSDSGVDRRKMDLAINLVDQYRGLLLHWRWGDGIVEWIRQCEAQFGITGELRNVLRSDVWPHAGRSSFVTLLTDKAIETGGIDLTKAVGLRLTFRQPPPLKCFSNQFLFYLNSTVAATAYQTWAQMVPDPVSCLPPERFEFRVINMSSE